jgi:UDP-N-acetyl-D-mannosaminuronate dehydrogenase
MHSGINPGKDRLVELYDWRFHGREGLLWSFFDTIGASRAGRDLAVCDHFLAFVQTNPVTGPVDAVPNAVRHVCRSRQSQAHHARVVVVKAGTPPGTTEYG